MAACDSPAQEEPMADGGTMEFDVASLSRAQSTTIQTITQAPFAIFGDMAFATKTVVFDGSPVTYNETANGWTYGEDQYWFPKHEHSFVALHPYNSPLISDYIYSDSKLEFTYNYPDNYSDAIDALIATHRRKIGEEKTDNSGVVRFSFAHILTNVNVLVTYKGPSTGPEHITVDDVTFKNIPLKASYSITPAPLTGVSNSTYDWTNEESTFEGWRVDQRGELKIEFPQSGPKVRMIEANKAPELLFTDSDALLLLPNPDKSELPTELMMTYTTSTGETSIVGATIPSGWHPGTGLTLSLKIDNGTVQFSIEVTDWKPTTPIDTTVPRK